MTQLKLHRSQLYCLMSSKKKSSQVLNLPYVVWVVSHHLWLHFAVMQYCSWTMLATWMPIGLKDLFSRHQSNHCYFCVNQFVCIRTNTKFWCYISFLNKHIFYYGFLLTTIKYTGITQCHYKTIARISKENCNQKSALKSLSLFHKSHF